ncbi:uncharacterized protein [Mytilus edulis]|uniref:uncharacterized protein n=1 Tax=Mytilus edulis TaxID=6550 RepID=UPI0039EFA54C
MDIYSCFLAISILKISDAVFSFQCPVQSHWKHRADNICGSNSSYFCLYDKNNKTFVEFCRDHPDFEAPGKKIIVEGSTQETLQGAKCSSDFYQPFKFVTNGSYGCVLTKSYCNEEGQVVYGYGTTKNDTLCRCDYTRGYYFTIPPKQTCYCVPSEEDCSCHLKLCPPNYNLTQDYECLKVTERNTSFYCTSIHSVVLPKDSEILLSTNNSSLESYVLVIANIQCVRVVVLVLVLIISVYILISCVVVLLIQKDYSNRMKHLDSIKAEPDSQSLPANMQNIDNGVCHPNITCDICGEKGIHGLRWKCCDCHDFDMCSPCYMADKHDLKHAFVRVDTPNSTAFNVPTRSKSGSNKKTAKGIFPNAEVMRGPHWKCKNDDGGEGGVGLVKALETWGKDSYRGAVKISWKADNLVKNYRVGGEGCVDVIYTRMTETASGGNYYADHLPFVDVVNPGQILLKIGDKVVITLPLKGFRQLQDNQAYGGWDDDMNQCLEETGTIVGFLYNGMSVKVQYEDSKTWVINKVALTRKHTFTQGDAVTILDNYNAVKELQKGHGGWNDEMKTALGKNGRIVRLDSDGDMRIKIGDKTWIFNPACIMPIDDASTAKSIPVLSRQDTRDHSDDESETGSEGDEGGQAVAEAIAQLVVAILRKVLEQKGHVIITFPLQNQEKTLLNWSNELAKFVVTKASQYIYQAIKTDQLVAIIGSTGTGKSACAKHIAFRLKNEYGYTIVSPRQPSDIKQYFLPGTKQVFIIDDFIGKNAFDEAEAVSWDEGPFIYKILSTNDQSKVILTCRKTIWNPEICERLRLSASTFDLHTENMRLNLLERRTICETYLEKNTLDDKIIMMYPFLPSLCSIFSSEEAGKVEDFFTFPIQFIEEEINDYKKKSPVCHISLAVLAIKQKIIRKSFLAGNDRHLIIDLIWESGSQVRPLSELIHVIVSQLTALTDSYVKVDKGCFEFIHETMQDIVLYCIAKTFLKSVLKYSKSDVIKGKVELACIKKDQTGPVIEVGSEYEDEYFSRLARDLSYGQNDGQFADVFENNQNSFPLFRQKFLTYLKNNKQNIHFKSDSNGSTALHVLSSLGYSDYVSYVITLDTGMTNKIDAKGNTPLHLASMSGHLSVLKLLVGNGGNVEMLNKEELSPFFYACENNSISVVHYLLNSKKDFVKINKKYMKRENKSVLHIACLKGYIEIVKILLDHRATVDIPDAGELTPLHLACSNGQYKTAELLLNSGANVNALDKLGRTPVYHACTGDYKDIVKLLIKRKANINKSTLNGSTPLHAACEHEIVDIVNILLNNGAKVDVQDREVGTPLHLACRKGNGRIVQLLIDNRASINLKTKKDKMRPFHEACQNGHLNVIEILLENGVNYEKQNEQGWTGLFFSCANGNNHIVKTILSRKTDVNRVNQDRITALHIACMKNHEDVVNTLINKKANVNVTDIRGETSLYKACFNGNIEIVKILLHREADVKICSFRGLSPVAIAKKKGFNDIVALLDNKHN